MPGAGDATGLELLLIDGDNLLHAVRGRRDEGGTAWLLPRLARWRPAGLRIVVMLDGHPPLGEPRRQRIQGIEVHHAGSHSADDAIVEELSARPYAERTHSAVVTRDRALRERVVAERGQTRSTDWLLRQLNAAQRPIDKVGGGQAPVGIGRGAVGALPAAGSVGGEPAEPTPWHPGRGATRKRGNPHRGAGKERRR
jgi:predicted RNA-binding protein with PIN domain